LAHQDKRNKSGAQIERRFQLTISRPITDSSRNTSDASDGGDGNTKPMTVPC
jgi:hypothetical protein